jgi:hypothetical protein
MRTSRAATRSRIVAGEALPDVSRCLAFLSPLEVARFAFSTLTCAGPDPPAQTDDPSPASESPGAMSALSGLGSNASFAPNARSRTASEGRLPFGVSPASLRSRARSRLPHLVRRDEAPRSGPSRAPRAVTVASELRCTHRDGAHPRLTRGMFRRLQQSTNSIFKDEHPRLASRSDFARAVRSNECRRKPSFTTRLPLRCVGGVLSGVGRVGMVRRRRLL